MGNTQQKYSALPFRFAHFQYHSQKTLAHAAFSANALGLVFLLSDLRIPVRRTVGGLFPLPARSSLVGLILHTLKLGCSKGEFRLA